MSEEQLKAFWEAIQSDQALQQKLQGVNDPGAIVDIAKEAGFTLSDIVKITVYLQNLEDFQSVNLVMSEMFSMPYPARAAVEVSRLPKDVLVEMDAIIYIGD